YRDTAHQGEAAARAALASALAASSDPEILWGVGAQLAEFAEFDAALEAVTRAAKIDAKSPKTGPDRAKLDQAVAALLRAPPADYAARFQEFCQIYRRPAGRVRVATGYAPRRCAPPALLARVDCAKEPFLELKRTTPGWRVAIAAEIGTLAAASNMAEEAREHLRAGQAAFRRWLAADRRRHAADHDALADCRRAEIRLAH